MHLCIRLMHACVHIRKQHTTYIPHTYIQTHKMQATHHVSCGHAHNQVFASACTLYDQVRARFDVSVRARLRLHSHTHAYHHGCMPHAHSTNSKRTAGMLWGCGYNEDQMLTLLDSENRSHPAQVREKKGESERARERARGREREGDRARGRESEREGGKEGGRDGWRDGWMEGGRERER